MYRGLCWLGLLVLGLGLAIGLPVIIFAAQFDSCVGNHLTPGQYCSHEDYCFGGQDCFDLEYTCPDDGITYLHTKYLDHKDYGYCAFFGGTASSTCAWCDMYWCGKGQKYENVFNGQCTEDAGCIVVIGRANVCPANP